MQEIYESPFPKVYWFIPRNSIIAYFPWISSNNEFYIDGNIKGVLILQLKKESSWKFPAVFPISYTHFLGFFCVSKNICNKDLFVRSVTTFLYTYLKLLSLQPQSLHVNTVATRTVDAKIKHALCDRTGFVYGSYILSPSCVLGVSGSRIEFFKKSLGTSVGLRVHRRWCRSRRGSKNMQPQMQWGNCGFAPFFCHRIDTRWGNVDHSVYFVWTRH